MLCTEDCVQQEHLLRKIDAAIDFNKIYSFVENSNINGVYMPKKFYTLLKIDKYDICLTSKTVYVYEKCGNEIVKFKDLNYAYKGCVSPD